MLSFFTLNLSFMISNDTLVPISEVKRFMSMPRKSETAKPFIGPLPNWNRTAAVMSVVTCESTIVHHAWSYPALTADLGVRPVRSSSLSSRR